MPTRTDAPVAILMPTLRRPDDLERALRSLFAQAGVDRQVREIVVIDNDPRGTAQAKVMALQEASPWPLIYVQEPMPGVANACNRGLTATTASLIAFLDDDEKASPTWLQSLLTAQTTTGADVVFGPIQGQAPFAPAWLRSYLEHFFGREGPTQTRLIDKAYGCGNSLMVRATALPGPAPFSTTANEIGGEDDVLFAELRERQGRFGWAHEAWVDEYVPVHRSTLRYALTRAFAYGQSPCQDAARAGNWSAIPLWMCVGLGQAVVYGSLSGLMTLIQHPRRAFMLSRTAAGLGKIFWGKSFEPHFYGQAELNRLNAAGT
ncbi:MAG: glycosyltransferase family 2 protein [Brevundimonas sp.]|nr:MAG: glycosyltransferase family 2 protein [Brevundimonas sp.]